MKASSLEDFCFPLGPEWSSGPEEEIYGK
jgi:hypothetical protein